MWTLIDTTIIQAYRLIIRINSIDIQTTSRSIWSVDRQQFANDRIKVTPPSSCKHFEGCMTISKSERYANAAAPTSQVETQPLLLDVRNTTLTVTLAQFDRLCKSKRY